LTRPQEFAPVVVIEGRDPHDGRRVGTAVDAGIEFARAEARLRRLTDRDRRARPLRFYALTCEERWCGSLAEARLFLQARGICVRRPEDALRPLRLSRRRRSLFRAAGRRALMLPDRLPPRPRKRRSSR